MAPVYERWSLAECEGVALRNRVAHFEDLNVKNCSLFSRSCDRERPQIRSLNDQHSKFTNNIEAFQCQLQGVLYIHSSKAEAGPGGTQPGYERDLAHRGAASLRMTLLFCAISYS